MNTSLIGMFNKAIRGETSMDLFRRVNNVSVRCGYIVHPDCCTIEVEEYFKGMEYNPNSTFYKTWEDVTSKSREELLFDQIIHYTTTYGTNFAMGNGYVPNDGAEIIPFKDYKVIEPCDDMDMRNEILKVLSSGIALKKDTIDVFIEFLEEYGGGIVDENIIDIISNNEAQAVISNHFHVMPSSSLGTLRCIIHAISGNAMIIKSKESISEIKSGMKYSMSFEDRISLNDTLIKNADKLSRIFYRFKPLFMAMKTFETRVSINKIRRMAVKNHKPMVIDFWSKCLSINSDFEENLDYARQHISDINSFRKVRLLQEIRYRMHMDFDNNSCTRDCVYLIRNGKAFIRENRHLTYNLHYLCELRDIIRDSLCDTIREKLTVCVDDESKKIVLKKVFIPECINIALPTSEKNFIGNYPYGTRVKLKNNIVGIYWRNEWGTRDYDLHYTTIDGVRLGWNASYYDEEAKNIIYSGDMTNADPEATEAYCLKNDMPNGVKVVNGLVNVNKYRGDNDSKFRLFISMDKGVSNLRNAMVDPNNIILQTDVPHIGHQTKNVALVADDFIYLMDISTSKGKVPSRDLQTKMTDVMIEKTRSFIYMHDILGTMGCLATSKEDADIDLSNLSKGDLIKLLS